MNHVILDTNVILLDPYAIFKFGTDTVIVPSVVLEELDNKKKLMDEVGRNAREFGRIYMKLRKKHKHDMFLGVPLESGGIFKIEVNIDSPHEKVKVLNNDDKILSIATRLSEECHANEYTLLSNDVLMIAKADAIINERQLINLNAEPYEYNSIVPNAEAIHTGMHTAFVPDELVDMMYNKNWKCLEYTEVQTYLGDLEVLPNDFITFKSMENPKKTFLGRVHHSEGKVVIKKLFVSSEEYIWGVKAANLEQLMLMELLMDDSVHLVCGFGKAGTGKTMLSLLVGMNLIEKGNYSNMLVARPVIPVGKDIGFLPGEKQEKLRPWMQPIYDNMEFILNQKKGGVKDKDKSIKDKSIIKEDVQDIIENGGNIEVEALTYIRGRSIPDQFFIIDEAQNLTPHEAKTIITRAAKGTKIILIGDPNQIDHPYLDSINNGLTFVSERMKRESIVGTIKLIKAERSLLAAKASELLE